MNVGALAVPGLLLALAAPAQQNAAAVQVKALADRFVQQALLADPTISEQTGLPFADHGHFTDLSPSAIAAFAATEAADLQALHAIPAATLHGIDRATYAVLEEQLGADLQMRVCRTELWDVNHFSGWQANFANVAERQPVATAADRAQALQRWGALPQYLDQDITNLREGERRGYSAPQSVVRRVIAQMDTFIAAPPEQLPFYSPAARSSDPAFQKAFRAILADRVQPALRRYRDFLANEYLPKARTGIAVSDLPDGPACYGAFLRANTTLNRTPAEVYALGERTVAANEATVGRLGQQLYGTANVQTILARIKADPANHFKSQDELLTFSRDLVSRAQAITAEKLTARMPRQVAVVEPEQPFEEQAGVSSHYDNVPDPAKPSYFRIELGNWATETRAEAEITTVHELWPGHHLQIALARELVPDLPLFLLVNNSAYAEGWARYAEAMGEEAGIYRSPAAPIMRRIWPAHGMVVDPGLHSLHWTRQHAIDYLVASGRFNAKAADDTVDRIAVMPGQLTSYDSGGLTIFALRAEAQQKLGSCFQLKAFNLAVLEDGSVPLQELQRHVREWIAAQPTGTGCH